MSTKWISFALVGCCLLALVLTLIPESAHAQNDELTGDRRLATQEGLPTKTFDADKMPGTLEYALVIVSFIAMMAVLKYV